MTSPHQRPWYRSPRQTALFEYSKLKQTCPEGVYITLKPGEPTRWHGVLFVREGPYAPAILRFQAAFPSNYPSLPPTIIFISDIFHPLVTPLTTYTYTTGSASSDTISATDEERLPPGGFSLQHRFPHWFGRSQRSGLSSAGSSRQVSGGHGGAQGSLRTEGLEAAPVTGTLSAEPPSPAFSQNSTSQQPNLLGQLEQQTSMIDVLNYMKQVFSDEAALDTLPLEAAGNHGAWKAWRAHRISQGAMTLAVDPKVKKRESDDWDWNGVWEERVRRGINASVSDSVLYGGAGGSGEDPIRFAGLDGELLDEIRSTVLASRMPT